MYSKDRHFTDLGVGLAAFAQFFRGVSNVLGQKILEARSFGPIPD